MKLTILTVIIASLMTAFAWAGPPPAAEPSVAGMWAQVDEKGHVGGWFLIFEHDGVYEGGLAKMFIKPGEDPNPVCTRCTGDQKNAPSLGLVIIKGMQRKGLVYQNGSILDPRDGQVYHAKLTLSPDGQQLTLRGYIGFEVFGQNQTWRRLPNDVMPQDEIPANLVPYWLALPKSSDGMMTKDAGPAHTGSIKSSQPSR
jgi:Uncharacterized protein conserved in bacteria (DUF2147)